MGKSVDATFITNFTRAQYHPDLVDVPSSLRRDQPAAAMGLSGRAKSLAQRLMAKRRELDQNLWHLTLWDVIEQVADQRGSAAPLIVEVDQRPRLGIPVERKHFLLAKLNFSTLAKCAHPLEKVKRGKIAGAVKLGPLPYSR